MGDDKGFVLIDKELFIEKIIKALKPLVHTINIISGNKEYDKYCTERIEDIIPNRGPVGGIVTALSHTKTEFNIILSVDIPLITTEVIELLIHNHKKNDISQLCFNDKEMPLIALYNKKLKPIFLENLLNDKLKLMTIVHSVNFQNIEVPVKWEDSIINFNSKEDLKRLI